MQTFGWLVAVFAPLFLFLGTVALAVAYIPADQDNTGALIGGVLLGLGLAAIAIRLEQLIDILRKLNSKE